MRFLRTARAFANAYGRASSSRRREVEKRLSFNAEWMRLYVIWSTLLVSTDSSRLYPRQQAGSDYRDANTTCSGGKQVRFVNAGIAIMSAGTITGLMHWQNIRLENGMCVSGWNGIEQRWGREICSPSFKHTRSM